MIIGVYERHEIEAALIHQKDEILALVNNENFRGALDLLSFTKEMWQAVGYEYKRKEILSRLEREIRERLWNDPHWVIKRKLEALLIEVQGQAATSVQE